MSTDPLFSAVARLATASLTFTEIDLAQPFFWRKHGEGVRLAMIGTYHELQELAARLARQRHQPGPALTLVQHVLGQYHQAYRELQATMLGISDEQFDQEPAPGEWSLRVTLGHIFQAERAFFTLIHSGLAQQQAGVERPFSLPEGEVDRVAGSQDDFFEITDNQPLTTVLDHYDQFHRRVLAELQSIADDQFLGASPIWWEGEEYSLQYRLHRFEAHMRQHHLQIEKTLAKLNQPETEAKRLVQLLFRGAAQVENSCLGAAPLGLENRQELAQTILDRTAKVLQVVAACRHLETAVDQDDLPAIQQITGEQPALANALGQNGLSLLMNAVYNRKSAVIDALRQAGAEPDVFAAAALGDLDRLQALADRWSGYLNLFARDGFTPLQLACYFNQEAAALWLMEQGAEVNAVARNKMKITPLHAAATHGNLIILRRLLENGAEVNAQQEGGYTAVHQAAHRNNVPMARLLLEFGADPHLPDANGRSALQLAKDEANEAVTAVLNP